MAYAPWETPPAAAPTTAPASTPAPAGAASYAPWETPSATPQAAPVGVGRTGMIDRTTGLPPPIPSEAVLNAPVNPKPPVLTANGTPFDYSTSPLRYVMDEDTARDVVKAAVNKQHVDEAYESGMHSAVLGFLPQSLRDHMATMVDAAMSNDKSWDQLATEYRTQDDANNKEHQIANLAGKGVGTVADAAAVGATNPAVVAAAGSIVRGYLVPAAKFAAKYGAEGLGFGAAYHYLNKMLE